MVKVLIHEYVTGGGLAGEPLPDSLAREGHAMRRALVREFQHVGDAEVRQTLDPRFEAEEGVLVGPGEELATLERLSRMVDFTLVIAPETDGILERRAALIEKVGASLGSSPEAVALTTDKHRFARHLDRLGIRSPKSARHDPDGPPPDLRYPLVVKPLDGAGCLQTYKVGDRDELLSKPKTRKPMLIQEYCPGLPMSASFLVGRDGEPNLWGAGRQCMALDAGSFHYEGGRIPAPVDHASEDIFDAVRSVKGLRGWVGVDYIRDPDTGLCSVLEINPRPTTSIAGWLARGRPGDLARAWLDLSSGRPARLTPYQGPPFRFLPDGTILE